MPHPPPADEFPWTLPQRRALLGLLTVFTVILGGRYACNPAFIDDPPPARSPRADDLADRLDPNADDWQHLAAIPGLGEKKARAIVAFREAWLQNHPNDPPFRGPQDLRLVKGIGPATVANVTPYLVFPRYAPPR